MFLCSENGRRVIGDTQEMCRLRSKWPDTVRTHHADHMVTVTVVFDVLGVSCVADSVWWVVRCIVIQPPIQVFCP